ncbi:MAG: 16S rRNA (cytidine(1402)-2'-O)-methyltransferase [Deltaproteobacteria bacterium]|nr:MAG: 16S rRNA (cytidine(1402)-2'-O)-methyltransferase [Deltaproteobacteria bacterium]
MKRFSGAKGVLYVVATPIGNLGDITLRALEVLKEVDVIAAEGVNRTKALCNYYGIKTRLRRFNQHNQRKAGPELIGLLGSGKNVALVTNAGTPCISDPGVYLVSSALEAGLQVVPVPGPSAVTAGLSVSGTRADKFVFLGFLPARRGQRRKELDRWKRQVLPLVIYEAPHRIKDTLRDILEVIGEVRITMLRELTKVHEEIRRHRASEMLKSVEGSEVRGEIVLVVEAASGKEEALNEEIKAYLDRLVLREDLPIKQIATKISAETGSSYRKIYKACLEMRRALKEGMEGETLAAQHAKAGRHGSKQDPEGDQ